MLVETLQEIAGPDNAEATIANLKLENETLRHRHKEEIMEIKKNINSILKDIQKSILEERARLMDETRAACEQESLKRVQDAKLKQWCSNCLNEAFFFCCWNTSYCDYNCQKAHWSKHASECQNTNGNNAQQLSSKGLQPILLKPAFPPKNFAVSLYFLTFSLVIL